MEEYLKLVDAFFTFKSEYEKKYKEALRKISKKDIPLKEKRRLVASIPRKCIQCKKVGGTQFEITSSHYNAVCSAKEVQCSLNLNIPRQHHYNINYAMSEFKEELIGVERSIIELKLKQIFSYITPEDLVERFEEASENYKEGNTILETLQAHINDLYDHKNINTSQISIQNMHNILDEIYSSYVSTGEDKYIDDMVEQNIMLMHADSELNDAMYLERKVEIEVKDDDSTVIHYKKGGDLITHYEKTF